MVAFCCWIFPTLYLEDADCRHDIITIPSIHYVLLPVARGDQLSGLHLRLCRFERGLTPHRSAAFVYYYITGYADQRHQAKTKVQ